MLHDAQHSMTGAGALETMRHTVHTQWTASASLSQRCTDAPECVLDLEACVQYERSKRQETPMCLPNMLAKVCGERSKGAPALAQVATNKPCVGHHAHAAIFVRALRAPASGRRHATPRCHGRPCPAWNDSLHSYPSSPAGPSPLPMQTWTCWPR